MNVRVKGVDQLRSGGLEPVRVKGECQSYGFGSGGLERVRIHVELATGGVLHRFPMPGPHGLVRQVLKQRHRLQKILDHD